MDLRNSGGGITNAFNPGNPGFLLLTNTIVTENAGFDLGVVYDGDFNFIGGDPQLAPLGNYGGPTLTMPPIYGTQVIDAGDYSVIDFLATDQRGFSRWSGEDVDIGGVEAQFGPGNNPPVLKNPVRFSNGGGYSFQFTFTNVASADFSVVTSTNVALPLDQWTVLGNIAQSSPGQYQFTDSAATNRMQFYEVVSP